MSGYDFVFSSFFSFTSLGTFLLFSFSVPTQSVECSIFSFLVILDCWRSCQCPVYVHGQTRVWKVSVLQLPFCVCYSYVVNFIITTANTVTATITETFIWIVHNSSTSLSVRTFSAIAMLPVSLLSQQLNKAHWLKTCRANTSNYRRYVDSYTKWKAELFSAYLQKELTHDICVDFKPATEMKSMQPQTEDEENISNYRTQCSICEWIILQQQRKPKILGYKDTLFRL